MWCRLFWWCPWRRIVAATGLLQRFYSGSTGGALAGDGGLLAAVFPSPSVPNKASSTLHLQTMNYFWPGSSRPEAQWIAVGPLAQFPDVGQDDGNLIQPRACDAVKQPGCRILHVPKTDPLQASEIAIPAGAATSPSEGEDLKDQVVVFRYRDKIHAVDHVCCTLHGVLGPMLTQCTKKELTIALSNARTMHIHSPTARHSILKTLASS